MSKEMTIATSFKVKDDWSRNGGFRGEISLINKGKESKDWTLEFEADFEITKIWNAQIVSHVGNRYVIKSGRWNKNLSKGETTHFGFNARVKNRKITKPSNYKVNQQPLDVTSPSLGNGSPPKNNPQNNNPLIDTSFKVKDDWSSNGGFKGEIALTNKGKESKDWTLAFEADFEITKIWNAQIVSHVGDRYVIKSGRWNKNLSKGETTHFGFNARVDNRKIPKPSNYTFNQQPLDVTPPSLGNASPPKNNPQNNNPLIDTSFKVKNDWSRNGGFKGEIALTNKGNESKDWTLEFEADFEITKIWNAQIVSHVGDRYVIKSGRWNKNLSKGETTHFGFNARVDNHKITKPINYKVNQQPLDVSSPKNNDVPILKPNPSPKIPKILPPSNFSPQAITVGFEKHNDGTKYNKSAQNKDWDVLWSKSNWMNNYALITDDEAHSGENSLRITHRPDARTGGNADWELPAQKEYYLSYWVKFADNFDFDGTEYATGKLPGLGGAGGLCVGGTNGFKDCNGQNGFSARYFWREDGRAVLNLKHMDIPTTSKWTPDLRLQDSNGNDKYFQPGEWHNMIQRLRINDGNQANGEVDVWMDGEQVLSVDGYRFVNNNRGIDQLYFNTFHGGSEDKRWWPDHTVYSYWDDFVVSTNPADVGL